MGTLPYVIYFLGPIVFAVVLGRRVLKASYRAFGIGLIAFVAAWLLSLTVTQIAVSFGSLFQPGTFLYSVVVSAAAGLFEESSRYVAFRSIGVLRWRRDGPTGVMYAIGHSGMEAMIVGGSLLLTVAVVTYKPDVLPADILDQARASIDVSHGRALYDASERLLIGLLIHTCFTLVVLMSLVTGRRRFLALAMLWHFAHDMVGFNLIRLSDHWIVEKAWIVFILVVYSWVFFYLMRRLPAREPTPTVPSLQATPA